MSGYKSKEELKSQYRQVLAHNDIAKKLIGYESQRKDELPVQILQKMFILCIIVGTIVLFINTTAGIIICFVLPILSVKLIDWFKPEYSSYVVTSGNKVIASKTATKSTHEDIEMLLKNDFMPKLLSVFGNFSWTKHISDKSNAKFEKFKNLMVFPNCYKLNFDDCFSGSEENVSMEILEARTENKLKSIILSSFITIFLSFLGTTIVFAFLSSFMIPLAAIFNNAAPIAVLGIVIGIVNLAVFGFLLYNCIKVIHSEVFKGVVIEYRLPKRFKGITFLYENKISAGNLNLKNKAGFQKVTLEDVEFNRKYSVYSTDQVEARYLLTTGFIERFNNIKTAFKAEYIRAEFRHGELFLILGVNKDLFRLGGAMEETTYRTFMELFEEIYSVLDLTRQLKISQNTGL